MNNGIFRRVSFMVVAFVTAPVWVVVIVSAVIAWVAGGTVHWVKTGRDDYLPDWINWLFTTLEGWVRSWLGLPRAGY